MKQTPSLPAEMARFFWDIDFGKLDPIKDDLYIIQRLLELGDAQAVRWVRETYAPDLLVAALKKRRGFSPKTASFWSLFLSIPPSEVLCLQKPYLAQRKAHWPH